MTAPQYHERNPAKDEYEAQHSFGFVFVGNRESTAVRNAAEMAQELSAESVKLYHTYPSPGPVRRYVGTVTNTGTLRRAS